MEKYLVIYDAAGKVYVTISGYDTVPDGLSGMVVELPDGMRIKAIDVSVTPNIPVFTSEELEKIDLMTVEEYKVYQIGKSKEALAAFLVANPIVSKAHAGIEGTYSVTEEKQNLMVSNMLAYQLDASVNGKDAEPLTWNETGKGCEVWTLEEFTQLILEIKAYVKPLVAMQQHYEETINGCTTKEDIDKVKFNYGVKS